MAAGPTLAPGAAFGLYAHPSDDLAGTAIEVYASVSASPIPVASGAEDPGYPATNLIAPTNTGHLNLPSRPAKLLTNDGGFTLVFSTPQTISAFHLVYHNLDPGLNVTLDPDGGTPIAITIPSRWENGWWPSPAGTFDAQTSDVWTLSINAANSLLPQIGRLLLYGSGGFRNLLNDVEWGVEEIEEQGDIMHETDAKVKTFYELFGPIRHWVGGFNLDNAKSNTLISLYRDARNRILPWSLIPDEDNMGDAWFVRFEGPTWNRTRHNPEGNNFPFRVEELSRGLPWP